VRSVSEVYMHVTGANYLLPSLVGGKLPEGFDRTMETKVTDKAKVVEWLKKSIENAKTIGSGLSNADLDKEVTVAFLGGRKMSERRILMIIQTHLHEHLGQSIAYARSNGVTPPWSEAEQAPPAKK
ncbi:MAG TPA: DinB family protein, partial [Thermoanaerobaculia bacterium]